MLILAIIHVDSISITLRINNLEQQNTLLVLLVPTYNSKSAYTTYTTTTMEVSHAAKFSQVVESFWFDLP